jgi:uncharacterized protein (DUF433 family)
MSVTLSIQNAILEEAAKIRTHIPSRILTKAQQIKPEIPANSQIYYINIGEGIEPSHVCSKPKTAASGTTPHQIEPLVYAKLDHHGDSLTIIRNEEFEVFVTFPKQLEGRIALSENKFYPLVSTQKGDWFKVQNLNFRDLQAAVQKEQKAGYQKVRLEISIIETEIKHTPNVCGGDACIRNTRIPVWTLVSFRHQGATDSDLLENYPSIIQSDLEAAWKYYQLHKAEINQAIFSQDDD